MSRTYLYFVPCLVIGGLVWGTPQQAAAQTPDGTGIVRVSDSMISGEINPIPEGHPVASSPCPDCPGEGYVDGGYVEGGYCPDGNCRSCPNVDYIHRGRWSRPLLQIIDFFNPCGMCTHSPDHGFCPPGRGRPVLRTSVGYQKQFPDCWTGTPAATVPQYRPPVYMPTDTTQLGYYYQHVPRWSPAYGQIPGAPHPTAFHTPACFGPRGCRNGACPPGYAGGEYVDAGYVGGEYGEGYPIDGTYSGEVIGTPIEGSPTYPSEMPVNEQPIPTIEPVPADDLPSPPAPMIEANRGLERAAGSPQLQPIR